MKKNIILTLVFYTIILTLVTMTHSITVQAISLKHYLQNGQAQKEKSIQNNQVIVLMYHHITENPQNSSMISPKDFRDHILWLKENGYHFLSMREFYQHVYHDTVIPEKSVLITFDDGYQSVYQYAYPIALEFGIPMSFFIVLKHMQDNIGIPKVTKEQLKELNESGLFYIGNHTNNMHYYVDHKARLQLATKEEIKEDILDWTYGIQYADLSLRTYTYPYGVSSPQSIEALKEMKYHLAFTTKNGVYQKGITDPFLINRINVGGQKDHLEVFIEKITKYDR